MRNKLPLTGFLTRVECFVPEMQLLLIGHPLYTLSHPYSSVNIPLSSRLLQSSPSLSNHTVTETSNLQRTASPKNP